MGRRTCAAEAVTVIMPTLARAARAARLHRALSSVLEQTGVRPVAVVVVNGAERDANLVESVERMKDVRVISTEAAHIGDALVAGRRQVETPWFAELDDDDILLPHALSRRVQYLAESSPAAAVVTNGWAEGRGGRHPVIQDIESVARDPLNALARGLWLSPGGALFRTDAIGAEIFADVPRYLEWTCVALRLARSHRLAFLDTPTFVHYEDAPDGEWGSPECKLGLPRAMQRLLAREVPATLRDTFLQRLASACNAAAILEKERGRRRQAWRWHLRCLACGGWRYAGFTRRLLGTSTTRADAAS